jgi:ATP-dependent protease Clp ATPase subunit
MIAEMKARSFRCSFCGKSGSEVANIMAGTPQRMRGVPQQMIGKSAFICDECVRRCSELVTGTNVSRRTTVPPKDVTF